MLREDLDDVVVVVRCCYDAEKTSRHSIAEITIFVGVTEHVSSHAQFFLLVCSGIDYKIYCRTFFRVSTILLQYTLLLRSNFSHMRNKLLMIL